MTGGEYHHAGTAENAAQRLREPRLAAAGADARDRDHGLLAWLAATLVFMAAALSLLWFPRAP